MIFKRDQVLLISQIIFGLNILACIIIIPHYFTDFDQGGLSNYGTESATSFLFTLGFLSVAIGALYAAIYLIVSRFYKVALVVLGLAYLQVLISTYAYKVNESQDNWHQLASLFLLIIMVAVLIALDKKIRYSVATSAALFLFTTGLIIGVLTMQEVITQLLSAQLLTGITFGYLMSRYIRLDDV